MYRKHSFLWRTFTDFQKGVGDNPSVLQNSVEIENLKKEMVIIENVYKEYINENPEHFRAYLNLADVLMYQSLLGVDKINEAEEILEKAIALVPQAPQSYWMKSVADVYVGDFSGARGNIQKALDLNPNAVQSQEISEYVEKAAKDFPKINLYFFRQI